MRNGRNQSPRREHQIGRQRRQDGFEADLSLLFVLGRPPRNLGGVAEAPGSVDYADSDVVCHVPAEEEEEEEGVRCNPDCS